VLQSGEILWIAERLKCVRKHFEALELTDAMPALDALKSLEDMKLGEVRGHLLSIRRVLSTAMERRVFMYVPLKVAKYAVDVQSPLTFSPFPEPGEFISPINPRFFPELGNHIASKPFGEEVFLKFKDGRYDAEQMSLCLAAGASTAAVFHMMRVVEWGVRALGSEIGLRKIKEYPKPLATATGSPSRKKPKYRLLPIQNATWEVLENQLRSKIEKRIKALRKGTARDAKSALYNSILTDFHAFKEEWRNHVMHTRKNFDEAEALRVMPHVERFMMNLARASRSHSVP
jgi:hypothetical protein